MSRKTLVAAGMAVSALLILASPPAVRAFRDAPPERGPIAASQQVILVVADHWDSPRAELTPFEREGPGDRWRPAGPKTAARIGRNSLGWEPGAAGVEDPEAPRKREGDGRAPAGAFRIGTAFGYAARSDAFFLRLPYLPSREGWKCVDDPRSAHYNRIVRKSDAAAPDWRSAERMVPADPRYRWGVFIEYNTDPPRAGAGSCIFLHIWLDPETPHLGLHRCR